MSARAETFSITAQDQGTTFLPITAGRYFDLSVGVTGTATVTLQRRLISGDTTIYDVKAYSVNDAPEIGYSANDWEWRMFCKIGDFGSGTILVGMWTT